MRRLKLYFPREEGVPPPVIATVRHRLRFSEVDALGIAWHGRYPAFFEKAHTELGHKCGLTAAAYRAAGLGAPVVQFHTDYYQELRLDEIFEVQAALIWTEAARLNVEYRLTGAAGEVAATGYTVQLFYRLDTREPLWFSPPLWEECRARWRRGEFHG